MSSLVIHPLASDRRDGLDDLIGPERGIASVFRPAGFEETARRFPTRPLMRLKLPERRATGKGH